MSSPPAMEALLRPVMVLMSGRVLGFMAAFVIPIILARLFDQQDFGTYKQLFLVFATLFGLAQLGMAESLYYFLPYEKQRAGTFVINAWLVMTASGLLMLTGLVLLGPWVATLLNNPATEQYLPYVGLYLLFMLMSVMLEIVMTVRREHRAASIAYATSDLCRAVLYIAPVLLVPSLQWLLNGAVIFAFGRFCVTAWYLLRSLGRHGLRLQASSMGQHLAYALPFGLAGFIEILQVNYHLYAVSYRFDAATFAIYAVGCLQVPLIDILMTSTSNVMMVNMRARIGENRPDRVLAIWLDSVRKLAMILFPLVALLLVVAPLLIVLLFTESYRASVPVFMVWTASTLLVCLLTDGVLRVHADNRFLIAQNIIRLAIIASLIPWFINRYSLIGAVLVTTVATVVVKVLALLRIKHWMQARIQNLLPWSDLLRTALIAALAAGPALWVIHALPLPDLGRMVLGAMVYVIGYGALLVVAGPLQEEERQGLKDLTLGRLSFVRNSS